MPAVLAGQSLADLPVSHEAITSSEVDFQGMPGLRNGVGFLTVKFAMQAFWQHSWSTTAPTVCLISALPPLPLCHMAAGGPD